MRPATVAQMTPAIFVSERPSPARDRYKIFIIDEAHMVTSGGFNALLKIVEEPPEHVKFIFATTEPEKVIGTIRSRTHHYPFRLVPPAQLLQYVQELSDSEGVSIAQGVLPLVVRAGGGSVRDSLSLLDQLIAGSDSDTVTYERAVSLLGYTHAALLDEVVDAVAAADSAAAFAAIDRVVQTGQDPRRFVDDLLERLRDLIVVQATREQAASVLRGVPEDDLARMREQAARFAPAELSTAADVVNRALTDMTGATSPRLHLELMMARMLVTAAPAATETTARVAPTVAAPTAPAPAAPAPPSDPAAPEPARADSAPAAEATPSEPLTLDSLRAQWPAILERIQSVKMNAWTVMYLTEPVALDDGDVVTIAFTLNNDANRFKERTNPADSVSEQVRGAILHVLGHRVKFKVRVDDARPQPTAAPEEDAAPVRTLTRPTPRRQPQLQPPQPQPPSRDGTSSRSPAAPHLHPHLHPHHRRKASHARTTCPLPATSTPRPTRASRTTVRVTPLHRPRPRASRTTPLRTLGRAPRRRRRAGALRRSRRPRSARRTLPRRGSRRLRRHPHQRTPERRVARVRRNHPRPDRRVRAPTRHRAEVGAAHRLPHPADRILRRRAARAAANRRAREGALLRDLRQRRRRADLLSLPRPAPLRC
jgi:DNA polymerase III subunit gamma/tau